MDSSPMQEEGWGGGKRSSQSETAMQELIYRGRVLAWRSQRPGAQLSREGAVWGGPEWGGWG